MGIFTLLLGAQVAQEHSTPTSGSMGNKLNWKLWSAPRATVSLVLVRLGGTSHMAGVLGWRAQAGQVKWRGLTVQPLQ